MQFCPKFFRKKCKHLINKDLKQIKIAIRNLPPIYILVILNEIRNKESAFCCCVMSSKSTIEQWLLGQMKQLLGVFRPLKVEQRTEILQEAIARALRSHHQLQDAAKIEPWFGKIHRHAKADYFRKAKNELPLEESEIPDGTAPMDEQAAKRDLLEKVLLAIQQLPSDQKTVFIARNSMNFREIERKFGIPKSTAQEIYCQARARVHRIIGLALLEGETVDDQNNALAGVRITARHMKLNTGKECYSGRRGIFTLVLLAPGRYGIEAMHPEYREWKNFRDIRAGLNDDFRIKMVTDAASVASDVNNGAR